MLVTRPSGVDVRVRTENYQISDDMSGAVSESSSGKKLLSCSSEFPVASSKSEVEIVIC